MGIQKILWYVFVFALSIDVSKAKSLNLRYYSRKCPNAELIIHRSVYKFISRDPTLAAPLLRMHFHDCFVRGCDGSVLLNSTKKIQAEKEAIPNQTLRGFEVIDAVKSEIEKTCPGVVSCADILALAARDAVLMIGGPYWKVPTGRRDGRVSIASEALAQLPSPFANISQLKQDFHSKGLTVKDLVVLSGGHSIGIGHCFIIENRLYNFSGKGDTDPTLDPHYAAELKKKCKPNGSLKTVVEMDPGSSKTLDKNYYKIVGKRRGLFQSDAALLDDYQTRSYVYTQSNFFTNTFPRDFAKSMLKLGRLGVLTAHNGEIRKHCASVN